MEAYTKDIVEIKTKVESDLLEVGMDAKTIKASLLALEDILIILFSNEKCKLTSCDVVRNTQKCAITITGESKNNSINSLKDPSEAFILNSVCRNMGYELLISNDAELFKIELKLKKYHAFKDNILFTLKFMDKGRKQLYKAITYHIISVILSLILPYLTSRMIVNYTDNLLSQITITSLILLFCKSVYAYYFNWASIAYTKANFSLERNLYTTLLDEYFKIKDEVLEETGSGTLIKRINDDTRLISDGLCKICAMSSDFIYYSGVMIASFAISPTVFFAELVLLILLYFLEKNRGFYLEIDNRKAIEAGDIRTSISIDFIQGIQEVKLLNSKQTFTKKINDAEDKYKNLEEIAYIRSEKRMILHDIFTATGYAAIMIYLGYAIYYKILTVPEVLILFNYYSIIGTPFVNLIQAYINFKKEFCISCERIRSVIEGFEFKKTSNGTVRLTEVKGNIELKDVSFSYYHDDPLKKNQTIFNKLNLSIKAGSTVAFVGKSGCGKTTLLKIIAAQRTCVKGNISIDGINYEDLDKTTLYENISVINQKPHIFNMSIKENMLCAKPDASDEEIIIACKKASIIDDINKMENGFDTMLGANGVNLSGGQCQRLALARAFLRNTPVIILDEATSALDNITQQAIMNTINNLDGNHTVIIVAHRLSTIRNADEIFMIDNKCIVSNGNHNELLKNNEEYRKLYMSEENLQICNCE